MGRIMITGALGNVGGFASQYAIANGQDVTVADINCDALRNKYGESARAVYFDFTKPESFAPPAGGRG